MVEALEQKQEELKKRLKIVKELDVNRGVPKVLYFFENPEKVKGVWLDVVTVSGNTLSIEGNCMDLNALYRFVGKIDKDLGKVTFKEAELKVYEDKDTGLFFRYYNFRVDAELRNGVSLKAL